MRVEQERTSFAEIIIILETEEEAKLMWAKLNTPYSDIASKTHGVLPPSPSNTLEVANQTMFDAFDDVYHI